MPVWQVAKVDERPSVTLRDWGVFAVPHEDSSQPPTRHLVGWAREDRQGQVSSAIQVFDPSSSSCVSASGRVYRLQGKPGVGEGSDAMYVWRIWLRRMGDPAAADVTDQIVEAIRQAQGETDAGTPRSSA